MCSRDRSSSPLRASSSDVSGPLNSTRISGDEVVAVGSFEGAWASLARMLYFSFRPPVVMTV